jgi:prenyltransferase beta subunit
MRALSIRTELRQAARLGSKLLGDSAGLVRAFLLDQQNDDGGFRGRTNQSDLYYTVFGLEGLLALDFPESSPRPDADRRTAFGKTRAYLESFGDGAGLDFVHLCCLARAWASLRDTPDELRESRTLAAKLLSRLEQFRSKDGGYNPVAGSERGTAYACFLALGACQDGQAQPPDAAGLARCLSSLQTRDGAWTNELTRGSAAGSTNATAAALTVLRHLGERISPVAGQWLLGRAHPQGGFLAMPQAPIPDLLSTATALHALAGLQVPLEPVKESCLDFVDSLWTNEGAFHGHWHEQQVDCEYTFYGLLALGHLS